MRGYFPYIDLTSVSVRIVGGSRRDAGRRLALLQLGPPAARQQRPAVARLASAAPQIFRRGRGVKCVA